MTADHGVGTAIHTPDQRLRVFVSSTLAELADERVAVARAINALRLTPVMFEIGARPHPPQELYRAYLAQSDIFVGLYWQRYGWVGPGMDISGLEDEFRLSGGLPRLIYIKKPAPDREPQLAAMIAEMESQGTEAYRKFSTPAELGRLLRDDLALMLSERFATAARQDRHAPAAGQPPSTMRPTLPATSTSLIGREGDVAAVVEQLQRSAVRLLTLSGPGGIGKTRLAIAVGEEFEARSLLPPLFVPLAAIGQHEQVLPHIATVAGLTIEGDRDPLDVLIEHFAATPTLLILDNLEQVVAIGPSLDSLLSSCPSLKILATSRTVLRLRAEHEYAVGALAVPADADTASMDRVGSASAVQLFVDRAQAVRRSFTLTAANVDAVVQICSRLDGLPLAIELAAARTRLLEPSALLARLERVLDDLGAGPVDLPERQRTLRATVEWSVDLLDEAQRRLLSTLSIFADGWTVAAAASVSEQSEDGTLDLLDALAGHSLVTVDAAEAGPRFRMLVAVRELAAEMLAGAPNASRVQQRHAAYFAGLVGGSDATPAGETDWAERLRTDEQNLRVAIRWFFSNDVAPLPHLFRTMCFYWQTSDRMRDGRLWIDELRLRSDPLDVHARAEVLFTWAASACAVGDDDSALVALQSIQELIDAVDDPSLVSALWLVISWTLPILDDLEGAHVAASNALVGFRERNEPLFGVAALTVGMLDISLGRDESAGEYLHTARLMGEQYDNAWLSLTARTQLAFIDARSGRLEAARAYLLEVIEAIGGTNVSMLTATFALVALAQLALGEGDDRQAAIALGAVDGLRLRTRLLTWPLARRSETEVATQLAAHADPALIAEGRAIGADLERREALALIHARV